MERTSVQLTAFKPVGLIWDSVDYSCGYDATFMILGNLWAEDTIKWSAYFESLSGYLGEFAAEMRSVLEKRVTFEQARNVVRRSMHASNQVYFLYGRTTTSIDRIANVILPSKCYGQGRQSCARCGFIDDKSYGMLESYMSAGLSNRRDYPSGVPLKTWIANYLTTGRQGSPNCAFDGVRIRMGMTVMLRDIPPIMLIDLSSDKLLFDEEITFDVVGTPAKLKLRGIIYGGQNHFTCRMIEKDGKMVLHDGISTGSSCMEEGNLRSTLDKLSLHRCGEKKAIAVLYAKDG
ncbi:hypothetical protein B0H19DRAFT_963001 [Mycena capillaripes]|nr:hypothetical protein B0H19DRAFT_963001 [Mycena capillaripes]